MLQSALLIIHVLIAAALIGVVLLQRSEGGALGIGGGAGFMTGRGVGNLLTRTTAILAGLFFLTSIGLAVLASKAHEQRSILDFTPPASTAPAAPAPSGTAPAVPAQPSAPAQPAAPSRPANSAPAAPTAPAKPAEPTVPLSK